jgi:hypothetical protein
MGKVVGTIHIAFPLDYVIEIIMKEKSKGFTETEMLNPPQNIDKALSILYGLKAKGYTVFPVCKHIDKYGVCKGHKREYKNT